MESLRDCKILILTGLMAGCNEKDGMYVNPYYGRSIKEIKDGVKNGTINFEDLQATYADLATVFIGSWFTQKAYEKGLIKDLEFQTVIDNVDTIVGCANLVGFPPDVRSIIMEDLLDD